MNILNFIHHKDGEEKASYFYNGVMVHVDKRKVSISYTFASELNETKYLAKFSLESVYKQVAYAISKMIENSTRDIKQIERDYLNEMKVKNCFI